MQVRYSSCPLCGSEKLQASLACRDYTVSNETFSLVSCGDCGFLFTQDVPGPDAIGKYYESQDYVSHTQTSKGLINRLYQAVKGYNIGKKLSLIASLTGEGKNKLVDYGCGAGDFLAACKKTGWDASGYEPSDLARTIAEQKGIAVSPPEEIKNITPASVDVITLWHVLEHVHTLKDTINLLGNTLKPGGKLVIAVPNSLSADAKHYKELWAAYDVPRHLYHFHPHTIKKLIEGSGFRFLKQQPMLFDSFYVSLLSEKYKRKGKVSAAGLMSGFWQGLFSNLKASTGDGNYSSLIYIFEKN